MCRHSPRHCRWATTRELLRQRADVRVAERRLAAATARVGVATADLFPRLSLSGFVGFLGGDASGLVNGNNKAWSLTVAELGSIRLRHRACTPACQQGRGRRRGSTV